MSQASRYKALSPVRVREQVARELSRAVSCTLLPGPGEAGGAWVETMRFDVHAAREHGERLVLFGRGDPSLEQLAVYGDWRQLNPDAPLDAYPASIARQHEAFVRWTRAQGHGPENREPGAFDPRECGTCRGMGRYWRPDVRDGRERAGHFQECHCEGRGPRRGGWPGKLARQWGGDSRAPMGRSLARLGRHILDMLDGERGRSRSCWSHAPYQGAECSECSGRGLGERRDGHMRQVWTCPGCQATGHNLAGRLPAVEVTPQTRRRVVDAHHHADAGDARSSWPFHVRFDELVNGYTRRTRVTARGEHRVNEDLGQGHAVGLACTLDERITAKGWDGPWYRHGASDPQRMPRWRRGELKHAEQRRSKSLCSWCGTTSPGNDPCDHCALQGVM